MSLNDRMAHYRVPGVSVAVINDNRLEWAKGYGLTEVGGTRKVTIQTLFQAASISKPVTAMAALSLVQDGRLALDEDVNLKLTSWKVPDNQFTREQKVTLRRLLSHSAGFNVEDVGSYAPADALPTLVQALDGREPAHTPPIRVEAVPGSTFRYSGGGYSVVQQLLIDVVHKPFAELMQEMVLSKAGMASSTFGQPLPAEFESIAATGHDATGKPFKGRWYSFPQAAAAGLWTTPSDLARFAIQIQRSYRGDTNSVLSAAMTREMLAPRLNGYGLGLWVSGKGSTSTFSHPGQNEGFLCILFAYAERGQGAVVMTNGDGGNGLFNEILRAIGHEYGWPDYRPRAKTAMPDEPTLNSSYVGEYDVSGIRTTVSTGTDGRQLFVAAPPVFSEPTRLYRAGTDRFFVLDNDVELTFVRDAQDHVTAMRVVTTGQNVTARKVK